VPECILMHFARNWEEPTYCTEIPRSSCTRCITLLYSLKYVNDHLYLPGWCLFEFACKLASTSSTDSAALGIAWKAFVNFGSRKDGFDAQLYELRRQLVKLFVDCCQWLGIAASRFLLVDLVTWGWVR